MERSPLPLVVPWSSLPDLEAVAALHHREPASLLAEEASFPRGVSGVALVGEGGVLAAGLLVDHPDVDKVALAQLVRDPSLAPGSISPMLDWLEARGRSGGAQSARVSLLKAPGVGGVLGERGYRLTESFLRMELRRAVAPAGALPAAWRESTLEAVGVSAYLGLSNAAFATVPGALPVSEDDFASMATAPGFQQDRVAVVVDAQGPVGFVCCLLDDGVGEVDAVGVGLRGRGRGLGRWLLRWAAARLQAQGAEKVQIFVAQSNEAARELYLSEGYAVAEVRESWERALA